jgi:putative transposase
VRDELLDVEEFACLAEARVVIGDWREDYNRHRPHSSLGMRAPAVFAAQWTASKPALAA